MGACFTFIYFPSTARNTVYTGSFFPILIESFFFILMGVGRFFPRHFMDSFSPILMGSFFGISMWAFSALDGFIPSDIDGGGFFIFGRYLCDLSFQY